MSKIIAFSALLAFFVASHVTFAQPDTIRWHPGVRLQFSDFSILASRDIFFVDVITSYEASFQTAGNWKYIAVVNSDAVFTRRVSSLPDSSIISLRYAQLLFNVAAYQAKLYRLKAFELGEVRPPLDSAKRRLDQLFFEAKGEVAALSKAISQDFSRSASEEVLFRWEAKVAQMLNNVPEVVQETQIRNLELGIFLGLGHSFFTSKTKLYFTDASALNFGFNVDVKRSRMEMDLNLGFNKTKNSLIANGQWPSAMKTNLASVEFTYGLKLKRGFWLTVPYIGLGINELSPARSKSDDKRTISGYSPVLGLEVNRNFSRRDDALESVLFFYSIKASVNPSNLIKNYAGTQFNVKVAVGMDVARKKKRLVKRG